MDESVNSAKRIARLAGWLYLLLAITGAYSVMYVPAQIMVQGDPVTTAQNMLACEFLFRTGVVSNLIAGAVFVFLVMTLHRLLKQVNMHLAKTMVALVIVAVSIGFLGNICKFTALMLLKGNLAGSFEPDQVYDLVALFLKIDAYGIEISQLYWGLWLFPFGLLVYRSGFIPRILGLLLIVNGVAYIILYLTFVLFPDYISVVYKFGTPFMAIGEIPTMFWLLIKGVKRID